MFSIVINNLVAIGPQASGLSNSYLFYFILPLRTMTKKKAKTGEKKSKVGLNQDPTVTAA